MIGLNIFSSNKYLNICPVSSVKALAGLQFLLNRVQMLQENGSKFSLSGKNFPSLIIFFGSWCIFSEGLYFL